MTSVREVVVSSVLVETFRCAWEAMQRLLVDERGRTSHDVACVEASNHELAVGLNLLSSLNLLPHLLLHPLRHHHHHLCS